MKDELRFTERLISKRNLTAQDWARSMFQVRSMQLLCGDLCPYRMGILGAVLVDKQVCESTDYVKLSIKLRGFTQEARLLRMLFETRIRQRILESAPDDLTDKVRRVEARRDPTKPKPIRNVVNDRIRDPKLEKKEKEEKEEGAQEEEE